jgi:CheY-like chemotaxis protein
MAGSTGNFVRNHTLSSEAKGRTFARSWNRTGCGLVVAEGQSEAGIVVSTANAEHDRAPASNAVLIVDDDALIRHDLAEKLRAAGFLVTEAKNAGEARALINAGLIATVLLTDLRMPHPMDGLTLARFMRMHSPRTKIVLMSGHLADANTPNVADATFAKPVDAAALVARLRELAGNRDASEQELA